MLKCLYCEVLQCLVSCIAFRFTQSHLGLGITEFEEVKEDEDSMTNTGNVDNLATFWGDWGSPPHQETGGKFG